MGILKRSYFVPLLILLLPLMYQNCGEVHLIPTFKDDVKNPFDEDGDEEDPPVFQIPAQTFALSGAGGCALKDNSVYCWGINALGVSGNTTIPTNYNSYSATPSRVNIPTTDQIIRVSRLGYTACAETINHSVYCWGSNISGELGNASVPTGYTGHSITPVQVESTIPLHSVTGGSMNCALSIDGLLYCWGGNFTDNIIVQSPTLIPIDGTRFTQVDGYCGLTTEGKIHCWGDINYYGALGTEQLPVAYYISPVSNPSFFPTYIGPVSSAENIRFVSVSAVGPNACGLTDTKSIYCWGSNRYGQLANPNVSISSTSHSTTPVLFLENEGPYKAVSANSNLICAVKENGTIVCRGENLFATNFSNIIQAPTGSFIDVKADGVRACGLTNEGDIYCWGSNDYGALGGGSTPPGAAGTLVKVQLP